MPITKTAKRALRSSKRKELVNKKILTNLEVALRLARKSKSKKNIKNAMSSIDRSVKKKLIHKNKAARMKSALSKLSGKNTKTKKSSKAKLKKKASVKK